VFDRFYVCILKNEQVNVVETIWLAQWPIRSNGIYPCANSNDLSNGQWPIQNQMANSFNNLHAFIFYDAHVKSVKHTGLVIFITRCSSLCSLIDIVLEVARLVTVHHAHIVHFTVYTHQSFDGRRWHIGTCRQDQPATRYRPSRWGGTSWHLAARLGEPRQVNSDCCTFSIRV